MDASRTWVCYWNLHSLELLEVPIPDETKEAVISFLKTYVLIFKYANNTHEKLFILNARCQNSTGGFGGGPLQYSHLAPTYAAINALVILQSEEAYSIIDRYMASHFYTAWF